VASPHLAPEGEHVGLDATPGRAVVVEACDAAVDLEGGYVEELPLERVDHGLAHLLPRGADGLLQPARGGPDLHLERFERVDGGDELGRGGAAAGLERAHGLRLRVHGGLPLRERPPQRVLRRRGHGDGGGGGVTAAARGG
jgi:hypothetical protein